MLKRFKDLIILFIFVQVEHCVIMRFRIITSTGLIIIWLLSSFTLKHQPRVLSFEDFEPHLHFSGDTIYLVNFWTSWCPPCVDELPAFERIGKEYQDQKVKILLVSLDFPKQIESKLIPFIQKNQIRSEVLVLDDPDANKWINRVDPNWSGAIPATLIYNKNSRDFHEGSLTYDQLKSIVEQNLKLK